MLRQKINYRFSNEILISMKSSKDYMFLCAGTLDNSIESMYRFINSIEEKFFEKASIIEIFLSEKDQISKYIKNLLKYYHDDHETTISSITDNPKEITEINNYNLDYLPTENYDLQHDQIQNQNQNQNKFMLDDGTEFGNKLDFNNSDGSFKESNHADYLKNQIKTRRVRVCVCAFFLVITLIFLFLLFY